MGPGSFDPGNKVEEMTPPKLTVLQWGRGLLTPEMGSRRSGQFSIDQLQWGRGLLTPEIRIIGLHFLFLLLASMGPGSFDPGNIDSLSRSTQHKRASMGPGSFDPGNSADSDSKPQKQPASMGPGSFDPGNRCASRRPIAPPSRFNGAGVF